MSPKLIKVTRGFTDGSRLDWLHPSYGIFPDLAADYLDCEEKFEVLVWDCATFWIAAVKGPDCYHGGHPHSYRWVRKFEQTTIVCSPNKSKICEVDIIWFPKENILKQVATASIQLYKLTEPHPAGWE